MNFTAGAMVFLGFMGYMVSGGRLGCAIISALMFGGPFSMPLHDGKKLDGEARWIALLIMTVFTVIFSGYARVKHTRVEAPDDYDAADVYERP